MKKKQTKKVQIKMFKKEDKLETIFNSIDIKSLELYAEMMRDRYGRKQMNNTNAREAIIQSYTRPIAYKNYVLLDGVVIIKFCKLGVLNNHKNNYK